MIPWGTAIGARVPVLEAIAPDRARRARHRADCRSPHLFHPHNDGPDNTNNILALAFGVLVALVVAGSLWIMYNLNHNMMPMDQMMHMQR